MYIDEIKKLLKDIEKIIQGDRRWIEKGDYEIREKLESVLENKSQKIQYHQEPILIQNDFILPQFQKKNNIIPNIIDNKIPTRKIIKLPSHFIEQPKYNTKKTISPPISKSINDIEKNQTTSHGSNTYDASALNNIDTNVDTISIINFDENTNLKNVKGNKISFRLFNFFTVLKVSKRVCWHF